MPRIQPRSWPCAAQWCRERLSATPAARLLVIVPELARRHGEVRRVFDAALDPGYLYRGANAPEAAVYALEGGSAAAQLCAHRRRPAHAAGADAGD